MRGETVAVVECMFDYMLLSGVYVQRRLRQRAKVLVMGFGLKKRITSWPTLEVVVGEERDECPEGND